MKKGNILCNGVFLFHIEEGGGMKRKMIIIISILCLLAFAFIYELYVSYYTLDVTSYHIESEKINEDVHIVMIGDVHDGHCQIKQKVIEQIEELKPDLILCVGDIIDDGSQNDKDTLAFLKSLTEISDVYMSLGNHEIAYYQEHSQDFKHLSEIGVTLLEEEYVDITIHNQKIRLGGMYHYAFSQMTGGITKEDMNNSQTYQFLDDMIDTESFQLMMAHRPDSFIFADANQWNIDLVVSGHNHGGQIILPFIGGLYAPEEGFFPTYDYGLFQLNHMQMLITRGISSSGEYLPRFNNPGEIVYITLK